MLAMIKGTHMIEFQSLIQQWRQDGLFCGGHVDVQYTKHIQGLCR